MQKKSRGRPPNYVTDKERKPVVGLSFDASNNRYFNTHWKSEGIRKENFGSDKEEAIFLFQQWEGKRKGEYYHGIEKDRTKKSVRYVIDDGFLKKENESEDKYLKRLTELNLKFRKGEIKGQSTPLIKIPESYIYAKARELILYDIVEARKRLNLPIELKGTFKTEKSITLDDLGVLYFEKRRKPVTKAYIREGSLHWSEFKKIVNVKMISQLNEDHFDKYEDWVYAKAKQKKWTDTTINIRLSLVATVFNIVFKEIKLKASDKDCVKYIRSICNFNYPKATNYDPKPIAKEDYLKILNNTKDKIYRAVMLIALNCGMKETEVADIRIKPRKGRSNTDINLIDKSLSKPRIKTGVISVAILWDRTIQSIQEMQANQDNDTEFLFLNNDGNPIKPRNIQKWWRRERRRAGVDDVVKFENIRDSAQTVPVDYDPTLLFETKLLMGHLIEGVTNNYLHRRPNMVKRTCKVIEKHFFEEE